MFLDGIEKKEVEVAILSEKIDLDVKLAPDTNISEIYACF